MSDDRARRDYSHRDHRVFRDAYRGIILVSASAIALVTVAVVSPWETVSVVAVVGLALVGGLSLLSSERLVETYVSEVRRVRLGRSVPAALRVEVESRVGLERATEAGNTRSPNVRPRRSRPPGSEFSLEPVGR